MGRCEAVLWEAKLASGAEVDESIDPGHTGLIGVEFSPLTTSLGHLRDKQASAQPEMAGAVTGYLLRAGLKAGDWVAVNASGSFPGFILATLCAIQTMELRSVVVFSYGSSMYGGTSPEFTFPAALDVLNRRGLLKVSFDAIAPGGAHDQMAEPLLEDGRPLVRYLMNSRPELKIDESSPERAAARRMELYLKHPVKVFISCGGPCTSMGGSDEILKVPHGLVKRYGVIPKDPGRGLIFEFLSRNIPVVHLLYTKGICRDWHLPYE